MAKASQKKFNITKSSCYNTVLIRLIMNSLLFLYSPTSAHMIASRVKQATSLTSNFTKMLFISGCSLSRAPCLTWLIRRFLSRQGDQGEQGALSEYLSHVLSTILPYSPCIYQASTWSQYWALIGWWMPCSAHFTSQGQRKAWLFKIPL